MKSITLRNCLFIDFLTSSRISGNSDQKKRKITVHGPINATQLVAAIKEKFSGLLFVLTSSSEREFPSDQFIDVAICLFPYFIDIKYWTKTCLK